MKHFKRIIQKLHQPIWETITLYSKLKISFIVVGAQKSGTTALYNFLNEHPKISMSKVKETNFFSNKKTWKQSNIDSYKKFFSLSLRKKIYGEVSPSYMLRHKITAKRIADYNPDMKLVFILKNPIDRAYSQYKMHVKKYQLSLSFEECISIALNQPQKKIIFDEETGFSTQTLKSYIDFGHYSQQIKTYQELFPNKQMLFLLTEDLLDSHTKTMNKVFAFLKLPAHNTKSKMIHSISGELESRETRKLLRKEYDKGIKNLEELLNRDLSHWV